MCPGTTRISDRVKFLVTCSGNTLGYDSGKISGCDSGKESGTVSDKGLGKRLGKNSDKTRCARQGDFFASGSI
jgi:hypothetical protein